MLLAHFAILPDPRIARHRRHKLSDILGIAVCAVLGGAESFPALEDLGQTRDEWLQQFRELPGGIPSPDPFKRVLRLVDPGQLQACFLSWLPAGAETTQGEVSAIDGKTVRRAFDKGTAKRALHRVRAWATEKGGVLGQRKGGAKATELTAIPELREVLTRKGGIVPLDAMGCQRAIARQSVERQAAYVRALTGTQPTVQPAGESFFRTGPEADAHRTTWDYYEHSERGHGRVETRCYGITEESAAVLGPLAWPGLQSIGMVEATRTLARETSVEQRFYLTSLKADAQEFAHAVRNPWGSENGLPWTLDVTFREAQSRLRKGHGAENFAVLRHITLNLLRQEPSKKSLPRKRLACALDPEYLLKVVLGKRF